MDFFDVLSQNKEMTFKNAMIFLKDFFYNNKNKFEIILMRYEHQAIPKKKLIDFIRNDYRDTSLFMGDFDYKFSDILDDEDKAIDYLSKKRERESGDEDLIDNKIFQNYSKTYGSNNEYSNKINNKKYDEENEEIKNENIFDFEVNNINQNNEDGDDDEDNKYYHLSKKQKINYIVNIYAKINFILSFSNNIILYNYFDL